MSLTHQGTGHCILSTGLAKAVLPAWEIGSGRNTLATKGDAKQGLTTVVTCTDSGSEGMPRPTRGLVLCRPKLQSFAPVHRTLPVAGSGLGPQFASYGLGIGSHHGEPSTELIVL